MHMPSSRVLVKMRSEVASSWYVPTNGGKEVALLVKTTTTSIKALLAGCSLGLVFGKHEGHLCKGVRIYDIPEQPLLIAGVQREHEEHLALVETIRRRIIPIFLFGEMDVCLAWANLTLSEENAQSMLLFVGPVDELYVGPFTEAASHCLDCFSYSIDKSQVINSAHHVETLEVQARLSEWTAGHLSFIGDQEAHTILIDNRNEGEMLENAIWASLESVFQTGLYKSPQVQIGLKTRELTDVLAIYQLGVFLIEAKDLSVLQAGYERPQSRRTIGVQKQVAKAIGQLVGASKCIKRGERVASSNSIPIEVNRTKPLHCIVLLTELMPDGDWSSLVTQLINAMTETGDFFHVLDLTELIMLLKCSSGSAARLDYNLIRRCQRFAEVRSIHIRSRPAPTPK